MTQKTVSALATRALARLTSFTCFGAALASLALLAPSAFAATPVAIWDNNFDNLTNGGWTLDLNDNTANRTDGDGGTTNSLTIAETGGGGLFITNNTSTFQAVSVIIRCSGLDLTQTSKNQALLAVYCPSATGVQKDHVGVFLRGSDQKIRAIWVGSTWGNDPGNTALTTEPTTLALAYNGGNKQGTYAYATCDGTLSQVYGASGLFSSTVNYKGVLIGGVAPTSTTSTFSSASGLTITAVAIFDSKISQSDIESYKFPSEISNFTAPDAISGEKAWSDITFTEGNWKNAAGSTATLTLAGDTVLTLPEGFQAATVTVNGAYKLTLKGGKSYFELVGSQLTAVEREVLYSTSIAQTIPANHTYIVGDSVVLSGANTVANGGTLIVTNNCTATVTFASTGINGTVEIAKGATLTATSGDAPDYNNSTFKVNVYGTLNLSSYRWTFKGGELHLYDNAKVTGTGDNYGAVDLWNTIYAHKNSATEDGTESTAQTQTISAPVRYTGNDNAQPTFNVEENVTLVLSAVGKANNCTKFVKTGSGTLKLSANQPLSGASEVREGTLELACDNALSGTTTVSEGATLKVSAGTNDLTSHTNNGTVEVAGGTVTVSSSIGGTVNWTDGTLKVKVTADQATSGLTLGDSFTITKADDANVTFVLPSGEEVEGSGKTLKAIKTWVGAATGDWSTAENWSGNAVPTAEDMVIITNATVEITVADSDVMPKTLEIAKGATLKGTLGSITLLHVDANATLNLDGVTATTVSIDSGATLTINGTATVNALSGSGNLVLNEGATIAPESNVTLVDFFANWSGFVSGKGALKYTSLPGNDNVKTYLKNANKWTATIAFEGLSDLGDVDLNQYGNASSTISLTGCTMHFLKSSVTANTFHPTIELHNGTYGYGLKADNGYSTDVVQFSKLTGDGTFVMVKPSGLAERRFFLPDVSEFKGCVWLNTASGNSTFYIGKGRADYTNNTDHGGKIVITGEIPAAMSITNTVGNIVFQNAVTLTASNTETAKITGKSCEMDSGATVTLKTSLTETELKPSTVTSLPYVAWTTKPSGLTFTIDETTLPAKRWRVSQKSTGLYVVRKYGTMILVK